MEEGAHGGQATSVQLHSRKRTSSAQSQQKPSHAEQFEAEDTALLANQATDRPRWVDENGDVTKAFLLENTIYTGITASNAGHTASVEEHKAVVVVPGVQSTPSPLLSHSLTTLDKLYIAGHINACIAEVAPVGADASLSGRES